MSDVVITGIGRHGTHIFHRVTTGGRVRLFRLLLGVLVLCLVALRLIRYAE